MSVSVFVVEQPCLAFLQASGIPRPSSEAPDADRSITRRGRVVVFFSPVILL